MAMSGVNMNDQEIKEYIRKLKGTPEDMADAQEQAMDTRISGNLIKDMLSGANQIGTVGGKTAQLQSATLDDAAKRSREIEDYLHNQYASDQSMAMQQSKMEADAKKEQAKQQSEAQRRAEDMALKREELAANKGAKQQELALKKQELADKEKIPKSTGDQSKAAGFAKRAEAATEAVSQLEGVGYDAASVGRSARSLPILNKFTRSEEDRLYDQAQRDFVSAVLRRESGAAISDQEYANEAKKYFPEVNDPPSVMAQKTAARQRAIESLKAEAGPAYDKVATVAVPTIKKPGQSDTAIASPDKKEVGRQYSPSRNQTRIKYSDGTTEVIDGR